MKKILVPGLVTGLVMLVVGYVLGMIFNLIFPSLAAEYVNSAIFRPWSDPLMWLFFLAPLVLGFVFAGIWNLIKGLIKGKNRGVRFGFYYWLLTIAGMIISYSSFKISLLMVCTWSVSGLVQSIFGGIVLAKLNK